MSWNDERIATLRKLWDQGLSCLQISEVIGAGLTRNAVIGKVHRLGLSGRKVVPAQARLQPRLPKEARPVLPKAARPPSPPVERRSPPRPVAPPRMPRLPMPAEVAAPDPSTQVTLMGLTESACRWPLGDPASPDFRYCGGHKDVAGGPYCDFHRKVAYTPQSVNKKSAEEHAAAIRDGKARAERLRRAEASAWL